MLKHDPLGGHLFCFRGRRGDLVKLIWHDGQGACLFTGKKIGTRPVYLAECRGRRGGNHAGAAFLSLLSGIDWRAPQETWRPTRV
ncbi:IS66 family insertion sequence element accessory protein TnpB [Rhizobium beringeri]